MLARVKWVHKMYVQPDSKGLSIEPLSLPAALGGGTAAALPLLAKLPEWAVACSAATAIMC